MESERCPTIAIAIERGTPAYSRLRSCARPQAGDAMDELAANRKKAAALTRQVGVDFGAALTVARLHRRPPGNFQGDGRRRTAHLAETC